MTLAARKLASAKMILFVESTGSFTITDLGRIAAKYYIRHTSIEIFNQEFRPSMKEADVLGMLSMSTEVQIVRNPSSFCVLILPRSQFDQIQVRESELDELKVLLDDVIPCQVKVCP